LPRKEKKEGRRYGQWRGFAAFSKSKGGKETQGPSFNFYNITALGIWQERFFKTRWGKRI